MYPVAATLGSPKKANLFGLMLACAASAVVVVCVIVGGINWFTAHLVKIKTDWLDTLLHWIVGIVTGVAGWFMLRAFTVLISGMFQEKAIHRVERVYYPEAVRQEEPKFWPDMRHDIRFTLWALLLNVAVLPLYIFGIGFVVSILLNSYLLGREFFESAAGYHVGKPKAREIGHQHRRAIYGGGLAITLMTLVPLLNLFVPIPAVVCMVHVYHRLGDS